MDNSKPILHIEDDKVDAMVMEKIFYLLEITNKLIHKTNGEEAVEYLTNERNEKPGMILLDSNMPRMDGREFLQIISKDPELNKIPVIVLDSPDGGRDTTCQNVIGHVVKSMHFDDFVTSIGSNLEKLYSDCPVQ